MHPFPGLLEAAAGVLAVVAAYSAGVASNRYLQGALPADPHRRAVASFGGQIILDFVLAGLAISVVLRRGGRLRDIGWRRPERLSWFLAAIPIAAGTIVGTSALLLISARITGSSTSGQCTAIAGAYATLIWLVVIAAVVMAPIAEEVVFRGTIFGGLRARIGPVWAVVLSSLLFAAAHLQPLLIAGLAGAGVVLAVVYERSGSLWPGMLVHALINSVAVTMLLSGYCG